MKNILYILLFLPLAGFGQDNYSLSFDGEDDYVKIFDNPIFSLYNITIAAWVRGTDKSESQVIFSNYATTPSAEWYHMFIEEITGKVIFQIDNGEGAPPLITSITDVCDGEWHFIVGVRDVVSGQILVFVDGLEEASMLNSDGIDVLNPHEILIGKQYNFQRNFNGNIDDIQVWNIALSHSEIQSYMNCDPTGDEEGLVGYWNFNEGSGDTVYDISGNENHGIIYGATYSEDVPENNCYGCTDNLATNYDDLAGVNDSSCTYNTYPIEDENFKAYLQSNYPQTIVNDSLNINATLGIVDLNVDLLEILSLDGLQYFYDLINLNCVANNLSTLPELPSQIEYINCQWNQIDSLPNFPESLKNFDGRHNLITVVPALPNTMEVLRVCFNEVTTIPELPDSLKILFCAYNYEQLTYLPDFPDHLEEVLCFDNEIEQISDIPESMYKFMMQNNSITQIPNIPEGVNILNLTNNPIECVNDYPEQFEEQLGIYPPCSFLDEYTALMDSLDQLSNTNDQLASDLSVFETVEEEQDYSMSFDGDNDWVEAQSISIYDTIIHSLTISSWIKLDEEYNDYGTIVARRNFVGNPTGERHHFELTINPDRSILFSTANNQNNDLYTAQLESEEDLINTSEWCYVSVTFQNGEVSFYLNGDLILNNDFGYREMYPNNHWINIGRIRRSGGQQFFNEFNGNIRGVEIWDINLSQEDIQSYMYCPPTGEEHGLVGYWNFNEGSGVTVYDISGNGNNGVINGGAEFSEDVPESYNGCTDETALNYDESANCDNGSCVYGDEIVSNLEENLSNVIDSLGITLSNLDDCNTEAINALSSLQLALYNWNTIIDLQEGWNMFGYGCPSSIDVTEGLSNHTESIAIVKDNTGSVYMPEFDFNGIGDFTPGFGYQIKLSDAIEGFSLCDWYVNDIPEDNIVSLQEENFSLQAELDSIY